jgi:hypothetical protein
MFHVSSIQYFNSIGQKLSLNKFLAYFFIGCKCTFLTSSVVGGIGIGIGITSSSYYYFVIIGF